MEEGELSRQRDQNTAKATPQGGRVLSAEARTFLRDLWAVRWSCARSGMDTALEMTSDAVVAPLSSAWVVDETLVSLSRFHTSEEPLSRLLADTLAGGRRGR